MSSPRRLIAMPARFLPPHARISNACNEPCDMLYGPCACGAWHDREGWVWMATYQNWPAWVLPALLAEYDRRGPGHD